MRIPMKLSFSALRRNEGTRGEFGSPDRESSALSDMAEAGTTRARDFSGGWVMGDETDVGKESP